MRIEFESKQNLTVTYNENTTVSGINSTVSGLGSIVNENFEYDSSLPEIRTKVPSSIAANQITYHCLMPKENMIEFNGFIIRNDSNYPRMVMGTGGFYAHNQFIKYSVVPFILAPGASAQALLIERHNYKNYVPDFRYNKEYAYSIKKILAHYKVGFGASRYLQNEYYFQGLTLQVVTTPVFKCKRFYDNGSIVLSSGLGKVKESSSCNNGLLTLTYLTDGGYEDYKISPDAHLPIVLSSDEEIFKLPCITFGCTRDLSVDLGTEGGGEAYLIVSGGVKYKLTKKLGYPCCTAKHFFDVMFEGLTSSEDLLVLCIGDSSFDVINSQMMCSMAVNGSEEIPDAVEQNSIIVAIPLLNWKNEILDSMSVIGNSYNKLSKTYTKYVSRKELTREVLPDNDTLFTAGSSKLSISNNDYWFFAFDGDLRSISAAERNWIGPTHHNTSKWIDIANCSSHLKLVYVFIQSRSKTTKETYFMHPIVVGPHACLRVHMAEPGSHSDYLYYRVWAVAMPLLMPVGVDAVELNDEVSTMTGSSSIISSMLRRIQPTFGGDESYACNNDGYIPVFYDNLTVFSRWSRFNNNDFSFYSNNFARTGECSNYAVLPFNIEKIDFHQAFGFFAAPFSASNGSFGTNYNTRLNNCKKFTNVALRIDTDNVGADNMASLTEGGQGQNTGISGSYYQFSRSSSDGYTSIKLPIEHIRDPKTGNRSIFIVDDIEWDSSIEEEIL